MAIFYQVTNSMSTATLPPGADAVERGADDRPLLMGYAVPRMHRPGPPDARRMPLFVDARAHGKTAYGRISAPSDAVHVVY